MRWLCAIVIVSLMACDRPHVLPSSDGDGGSLPIDAGAKIDLETATTFMRELAAIRSGSDANALATRYGSGARIVVWKGTSSWAYRPDRCAKLPLERRAKVELEAVHVVARGKDVRVVATFDERVRDSRTRSLNLFELQWQSGFWRIHRESEIARNDMDAEPLSGFSMPVMADLSYRPRSEIAILRTRGRSSTAPKLQWQELEKQPCPAPSCRASLTTDLLTVSLSGDKLVDTPVVKFQGRCNQLPTVALRGSLRVFEREALVIEQTPTSCASSTNPSLGIYGVRGTGTERLLAMDAARVVEINGDSVTIEYRPAPDSPVSTARFVPEKQEERLLFRPEMKSSP